MAELRAEPIPSSEVPDGLSALEQLLSGAEAVQLAAAFVSARGAELLHAALRRHGVEDVALVARGAPITDPDALLMLRDEAGVAVSVVMGPAALRFHPKLWLAHADGRLTILSGSGNLTEGGLRENREQFELLALPAPSALADAHERRFYALAAGAVSLDEAEGTAAWLLWHDQLKRRRYLADELRRLDERLAATASVDRTGDKHALCDDLEELYELTRAARLPRRDGQPYVPTRFKQAIDRGRRLGDPVSVVGNICHRQTEGFDVLLEANRPELTVEALVVDPTKPYHSLFTEETRRRSRERLRQFPGEPDDQQAAP